MHATHWIVRPLKLLITKRDAAHRISSLSLLHVINVRLGPQHATDYRAQVRNGVQGCNLVAGSNVGARKPTSRQPIPANCSSCMLRSESRVLGDHANEGAQSEAMSVCMLGASLQMYARYRYRHGHELPLCSVCQGGFNMFPNVAPLHLRASLGPGAAIRTAFSHLRSRARQNGSNV
jgi:hypothetical protein